MSKRFILILIFTKIYWLQDFIKLPIFSSPRLRLSSTFVSGMKFEITTNSCRYTIRVVSIDLKLNSSWSIVTKSFSPVSWEILDSNFSGEMFCTRSMHDFSDSDRENYVYIVWIKYDESTNYWNVSFMCSSSSTSTRVR